MRKVIQYLLNEDHGNSFVELWNYVKSKDENSSLWIDNISNFKFQYKSISVFSDYKQVLRYR